MKKVLIVLAVLFVLLIAGVAVFLATFDADRYRPLVVKQMESALGKPVTLDRLSLGWRGGIAVELHGLAVYPGEQASGEPAASVERASAVVNLLPLIRKEVSVSSVVVDRPVVRVRRDATGAIEVVGLKLVGAPAAASGRTVDTGEGGAAPVAFNISVVRLNDGFISWTDEMMSPPMVVEAKALDLTLRNLSPEKVDIELRVSLFSNAQNLQFSGRVWLPQGGSPAKLEKARLSTDLRQWDLLALSRAVPAVRSLGLQSGAQGRLIVSVDQVVLDPGALAGLTARVQVSDGKLPLATLGKPVDNITLDLLAKPARIELKQASGIVGGGVVSASGFIDQPGSASPSATLDVTLEELLLEELAPAGGAEEPRLFGRVSASFKGTGQGLDWPTLSRTLNGSGRVSLSQLKLVNLNILREVFSRLSIIPGLAEKLQARLPASYQPKLTARETVFEPVDVEVTAQQGEVTWSNLRLVTDSFELQGVGRAGFDGMVSSQATLRIDPELSTALAATVNELGQLNDEQGRMRFPVVIQGQLPRVAVMPDLQYVASKIVATKAQEFLGGLLQRALESQQPADETGQQQPPAP